MQNTRGKRGKGPSGKVNQQCDHQGVGHQLAGQDEAMRQLGHDRGPAGRHGGQHQTEAGHHTRDDDLLGRHQERNSTDQNQKTRQIQPPDQKPGPGRHTLDPAFTLGIAETMSGEGHAASPRQCWTS